MDCGLQMKVGAKCLTRQEWVSLVDATKGHGLDGWGVLSAHKL
jgi:hypothetical protein